MEIDAHLKIISDLLTFINKNTNDFILKDRTALMFCYGLDRFSTDVDLDGKRKLNTIIKNFCKEKQFEYSLKKNTDYVERYVIHYDNDKTLKVEVSHRKYNLYSKKPIIKNLINTYSIEDLFSFKVDCLNQRVKIRDFYDICFIYNNYQKYLRKEDIFRLEDFLDRNEGNYYEYLINTQEDKYIDKNKFENYYINMLMSFK